MIHATSLLIVIATFGCAIASIHSSYIQLEGSSLLLRRSFNTTCNEIASSVSSASQIFYPESPGYEQDISHWASSSTQMAACSFEPGTPADVGIALRILGQTRTPFAVKSGGHATNPAFSSTVGVQISMYRFSDTVYDPETQTVTLGTGLIWDEVYAALEQHGVIVVGGRAPGVGVAGFTLGGGYSYLTNQHGLTLDTVQSYELVMPNGTVLDVTETSSPDLFFALKGCQNNFGIVTRFTLKSFPQTQVWGGIIAYGPDVVDQVNQEVVNFLENYTDPKASIGPNYGYIEGAVNIYLLLFYDAPTPPPGTFDKFLAIPSSSSNVSTRSYLNYVASLPANVTYGQRGIYDTVPVTSYSLSFLQTIVNETLYWGQKLVDSVSSSVVVSYDIEPFLPTLFSHNTTPTAYPPDRTQGLFPTLIYFAWDSPEYDQVMQDATRATVRTLQAAALEHGDTYPNAASYPNYAIYDTPLVKLYGSNLPRLYEIKGEVDPENVMGLAGGFKL